MRLLFCKERERFEAITEYGERHAPKYAGFRWDPGVMRWWTQDVEVANELVRYADEEVVRLIQQRRADKSAAQNASLAASRAVDADIDIPAPPGRTYFPYQRAGIAYALQRPNTLIGDEMGLGKTVEAIGVVNVHLAAEGRVRVLVVAPKIALHNWRRELQEWLFKPLKISRWTTAQQDDADIVIVNYDILSHPAIFKKLRSISWNVAIFDEAHALKTPTAKRTVAVFGDREAGTVPIVAERRLFLTGTPILNRPIELFPMLNAMGLSIAENYHRFAKRFCNGHTTRFGFDVSGASNHEELQQTLRATCMVRRLKADVLTDLPPKRYQLIEFDAIDGEARDALNAEKTASADWNAKINELEHLVDAAKAGDKESLRRARDRLQDGRRAKLAEMSRLRHRTALAKVPQVVEHTATLLDSSTGSFLLFAHHLDVIETVREGLEKKGHFAAVITGQVGDAEREIAQRQIREREVRLFIGSMHACGVAINLPEADTVIFAEQDWTPAVMAQCEDRAHRIGQQNPVLVQHLVLAGSIDADQVADSLDPQTSRTLAHKERMIEKALDGDLNYVSQETKLQEPDHVHGGTKVHVSPEANVPGDGKTDRTPEDSAAAGRKRGRPPLGQTSLTKAERNRRYREKTKHVAVDVPKDVVNRLRRIRDRMGGTNADILREALRTFEDGLADGARRHRGIDPLT